MNSKELKGKLTEKYVSEDTEAYQVNNTPFSIVRMEKQWYVLIGNYRLTTELQNIHEAYEDSQRTDWDRLMQIVQIMIEENKPKN